ncbi:type IV pilus assembly protein PilW [Pseudoxanthomonas sp. GM95]|uniref:PilW family protein n=1 Tax=Pseudoxanthomonas sp. GM95 TaxID=1881043 RepID=UPI0008CF7927|nr:PilW family protein [Pseudoxanthomonas sp. GM95]SEK68789.1 type IV pilus assembly protein PilW [Pseudoxanthomonas sp. GM95]
MTSRGKLLNVRRQQGLTLIEIMVALTIGLLLLLGLIQIFSASRTAYQLSEGLARTQEDGRFAVDFLQRDIRMAGHSGCVNDEAHALSSVNTYTTAFGTGAGVHPALRFDVAIQGYEATNSAPGGSGITIAATPATGGSGWSPSLPTTLATAIADRVQGSDILVLRFLRPEGIPVTAVSGDGTAPSLSFNTSRWDVLRTGVTNPGLFGVADCLNATVFEANSTTGGVIASASAPLNALTFPAVYTAGQSMIYRAESVIYYVGLSSATNRPALRRVRFDVAPGGAAVAYTVEDLVDGVENMQLLFARDRQVTVTLAPTGYIDQVATAGLTGGTGIDPSSSDAAAPAAAAAWKRVGAVQIGLLMVSPDRAAAAAPAAMPVVQGTQVTVPADGRYRSVYQTTVALRNRLFGG